MSCPPTSQTVNEIFLYSTVSTLKPKKIYSSYAHYLITDTGCRTVNSRAYESFLPIVGMVVTISPSFNLYKMVVLPAASRPTIKILISFFPKRFRNNPANMFPILNKEQIIINEHPKFVYNSPMANKQQINNFFSLFFSTLSSLVK